MGGGGFFTGIAPRQVASFAVLVTLLLAWATTSIALRQPWLGLTLKVDKSNRVVVTNVHLDGPARGLVHEGEIIKGIGRDGTIFNISSETLIEEPDLLDTYAQYNAFLIQQGRLYRTLESGAVTVITARGAVDIKPRATRPIGALPLLFWFQLVCGVLAAVSAVAVVAFKRHSGAARAYGLTGAAFLIVTFSAAVYSTRELALEFALFRSLSVLNHFGSLVFTGAFVTLLWHYPARLGKSRLPMIIVLAYLAIWVADTAQVMPDLDTGFRLPVIAGLMLSLVFAILQWRRSKQQVVDRAALKWFLFSLYLGGATFVFALFVTVWLGLPPPLSQGYTFGILTVMYLGIAVGISRYRLFELDRWWLNVWLWLIAGATVVVADITIAYMVNISHSLALALALALVGWVYFPARQWLLAKVLGQRPQQVETFLPYLLELGFSSGAQAVLRHNWTALLRQTFDPMEVVELSGSVPVAAVTDDGLGLVIPSLASIPALKLRYRSGGRRFFTTQDVALAASLLRLGQQAVSSQSAYHHGVTAERTRLAADLHDDVASRLLTLMHRAKEPALSELAREALKDLRTVVANLGASGMLARDAIADWRAETEQRCEAANVTLSWDDDDIERDFVFTAHQRINLQRILREAVSNALRHANADSITIRFAAANSVIEMSVRDSGNGAASDWLHGQGVKNMRNRVSELGGQIELRSESQGTVVTVRIDTLANRISEPHFVVSSAAGG